ncbi:MAG: efflux transporter outer membrane subunit [Alphaproteobacteria bacterium]|nr:efflux transporter outer membrane subunit [Alphaproteobacteria bacterium]MBU0796843.1 efflux transporter outer membrane subunit [Alphaproteobacteria bacterium]MBU0885799.1 efflux transporter outer membrane subunit [Alphaproteobacteria bacterium]MBU1812124.1 efflux transporter outer membrane subunit [Alphaproteobacteria bacterium]
MSLTRFRWATLALPLFALGCTMGPDYSRPTVPLSATYKHEGGWRSLPSAAQSQPDAPWWAAYGDPELDRMMRQAAESNQSVAQAEARYRQVLAQLQASRADGLPQIGASSGVQRSGSRGGSSSGSIGQSTGSTSEGTRYEVGATVSWMPDLWGRVRRQTEADQASIESSAADLAAIRLGIQATVAQAYMRIRAIDRYDDLLNQTMEVYARSLTLTRNQYAAGLVARADVIQSETQLQSLRTQASDLKRQRLLEENAIAVLLGGPPSAFSLEPTAELPPPPPVPAQLPAALLARRPDVAAAERLVAAANARIGVAETAWYPDITLSAQAGLQEGRFLDLLNAPRFFWSVGPGLALTLFDGGRRSAALEQSRAQYDEQVAFYRQSFLTGMQEVEDALASLLTLAEKAVQQQRLVELAEENERVVTNRYRAGLVSFLEVSVAQNLTFTSRRTALEIRADRLAASIQLVTALGGGWRPEE